MHTGQSRCHAVQLTSRRRRRGSRRSFGMRLGVVLAAFALIAVACGGGDDGGDTGDGAAPEPDTMQAAVEDAPTTTLSGQEEEVVEAREAGEATGEDVRETETGPVHGGKLVYGIEADSANPFVHYATSRSLSTRPTPANMYPMPWHPGCWTMASAHRCERFPMSTTNLLWPR